MAVLSPLHWETVSPAIHSLISYSGSQEIMAHFYLAGRTGLALQLGHRKSDDLDFFSQTEDVDFQTRENILKAYSNLSPKVMENSIGNLVLLVEGIRIGFFSYGYPLVQPVGLADGVQVASIADIGLMKLDALVTRGSRKDFYDLYTISRQIPLADLLESGKVKYANTRNFGLMAVERMIWFDNADRDRQPNLLVDIPWLVVKNYFIQAAVELGKRWYGE